MAMPRAILGPSPVSVCRLLFHWSILFTLGLNPSNESIVSTENCGRCRQEVGGGGGDVVTRHLFHHGRRSSLQSQDKYEET